MSAYAGCQAATALVTLGTQTIPPHRPNPPQPARGPMVGTRRAARSPEAAHCCHCRRTNSCATTARVKLQIVPAGILSCGKAKRLKIRGSQYSQSVCVRKDLKMYITLGGVTFWQKCQYYQVHIIYVVYII